MVNWRDLGEVPDSEDEDGLDTQNSNTSLPEPEPTDATIIDTAKPLVERSEKDIWDIPSSQDHQLPVPRSIQPPTRAATPLRFSPNDPFPISSPLSSIASSPDLLPIDALVSGEDPSRQPSPSRPSTGYAARQFTRIISSPPDNDGPTDDASIISPTHHQTPLQSQILGHDADASEARQVAVRYERSLRARKPEQVRPYFTEMARFANTWRNVGLRPLRFAQPEEETQRQPSQSPERDFEPESQDSNIQRPTDESQVQDSNEGLNDPFAFDLTSSPLRTSPLENRGQISSQTGSNDTDDTSLDGDDLPSLQELARKRRRRLISSTIKRKSKPLVPTSQKRAKTVEPTDIPSSPNAHRPFIRPPQSSDPLMAPDISDDEDLIDVNPRHRTPVQALEPPITSVLPRALAETRAPITIKSDSGDDDGVPDAHSDVDTDFESNSESEIVNQQKRRIRGVLPASWLRLDQLSGRDKVQKKIQQRQLDRSPEREQRRGVAQRRMADPGATQALLPFDESEDEQPPRGEPTTDERFHNQARLTLKPSGDLYAHEVLSSDDAASIIEDNTIDRMAPPRKRQLKLSDSFGSVAKRVKSSLSSTPSATKTPKQTQLPGTHSYKQPRIKAIKAQKPRQPKRSRHSGARSRGGQAGITRARLAPSPPRLSILDVIQPDAPQFLKVAARTAKRRSDQGRSAHNTKSIQLATRMDHVDAYSVLRNWREGSIRPRPEVTAATRVRGSKLHTRPLAPRSANPSFPLKDSSRPKGGAPRKFTKQTSAGGRSTFRTQQSPPKARGDEGQVKPTKGGRSRGRAARPAQMEVDDEKEIRSANFGVGKKLLDRLYRTKHSTSTTGSVRSGGSLGARTATSEPVRKLHVPSQSPKLLEPTSVGVGRPRRKARPQRIDVDAPVYCHANDPLPADVSPPPEETPPMVGNAKFTGLGPYGTRYTNHFETFPLPPGVYFHDSTLLGSGFVERVMKDALGPERNEPTPRALLVLGEQTMCWGAWDAQVSSELGVVFDHVADHFDKEGLSNSLSAEGNAVAAMQHVLSYVQDSMTFDINHTTKSFVARATEVVESFITRVLTPNLSNAKGMPQQYMEGLLGVLDRTVLISFQIVRLCDPQTMMAEQFAAESLLKKTAGNLIKILIRIGLDQVRIQCEDMNSNRLRELGLRTDAPLVHSWVLVQRLLEKARIPRSAFWDVFQSTLIPSDLDSLQDVRRYERLWKDMFILLPLVEFNDLGVLVPGQRFGSLTDGWTLPQRLLKLVFKLYKENDRQPPSFNNYCRALVGRCHYLVQEWGWHRSSGVVGIVFDFFGSQNLAHLRNEEIFTSPRFLENLAREPSLEIEASDRCFHIFLKLVALSIRKLRDSGSVRDIRNLVARAMPNHSRQHLKEQTIHERDLAALRNHHDLLCTLYWAAPPDLRPNVNLIERLVVPASSHKEACLINLRAWKQLARFLVATGEAPTSLRPFNQWRNDFFNQMMLVYDSVAGDIEQQFAALSKDVSSSVSKDMIKAMIHANKTAVMDVLHFSCAASLDVMKDAPDLESAAFCLSTLQLQRVFKHFSVAPPELDWSILRACLSTLESFLNRIDQFKNDEESQQSESQILNSAQADDALLVMNHDLAGPFFQMARCVLSPRSRKDPNALALMDKASCTEQIVTLGARLGMRFIDAGVVSLPAMFRHGKHGMFAESPHKLGLDERLYLSLFLITMLKYNFDDFYEPGFGLRELWMLAIVKPQQYLFYENKLAEQLVRLGKDFVPEAVVGLSVSPDYGTNRGLFEFAISSMRKSLRDAGPSLKKTLLLEYKRTLQLVMDQIKGDLAFVAQNPLEHPAYLTFVRDIISLIRAHGPDICAVDEYFYQISKEYSPSVQDPQLQVAGMASYGLRLVEGDTRVAHQLFFFLINNFKIAMMNDKMFDEVQMLHRGLGNQGILNFVLGKMLPSIVQASATETSLFIMVDAYCHAFYLFLDNDVVCSELQDDNLPHLLVSLEAMASFCTGLTLEGLLGDENLHLIRQYVGFMNIVWPSLLVIRLNGRNQEAVRDTRRILERFRAFLAGLERYIGDIFSDRLSDSDFGNFPGTYHITDPHISSFRDNIINDVRTNWISSGNKLSIQAPGKARNTQSTQTGQGIQRPTFNRREILEDLDERIKEWNRRWNLVFGEHEEQQKRRGAIVAAPVF